MTDFYIKQGDTAPALAGVLVDDAGAAVDIAGASLRLTMAPVGGGTAVIDAALATNGQDAGGATGAWSYAWQATDTAAPGYFNVEVEVTYDDGSVETFPNDGYLVVRITPELG